MRLAFLGTPEMAVPELRALVAAGHEIVLAVTRADRRRGRGGTVSPSPVKAAATELGIPVTDDIDDLLAIDAELGVVVAYGRIIKPPILAHLSMVNVHFSLLPRWRGAAPVERALLAGDDVTGVCIMAVEEGLDTGGVYARREVPIGPRTTAAELRADARRGRHRAARRRARPAARGPRTAARRRDVRRQDRALRAGDRLDLAGRRASIAGCASAGRGRRSAAAGSRCWPASPAAGGGDARHDRRSTALVAAGDGALRLVTVQPEGKGPMPWAAFANGARPEPHERLGP